jgi:nitrite reductase/ring-hydroxylating ferredoxin subunit
MSQEYTLAELKDVPEGSHIIVRVREREIGIFNVHGKLYALPNVCVHQNGPLCRGAVSGTVYAGAETNWERTWVCEGEIVVCPWHSVEYNITTGQCLAWPEKRLPLYPVHVDGEKIKVTV